MVPQREWIQPIRNGFRLMRAPRVTFSMLACHSKGIQRQHFCHHGDTICHQKSGYVTTKLHGTSTCGCNDNAIFSQAELFSRFLPTSYAGHVNLAAAKY